MSNEQTVSGGVTRIEIGRAEGELEILGWDESHIRIVGLDDEDSSEPEISDGILRLDRLEDDVTISVPRQASLHVLSAKNDLTVRGIQGSIRIDAVSGDVQMQDTGSISLGAVSGDAHIEGSQGGVRLDVISGDLHASRLDRLEITGNINGDAEVRDVPGEVSINRGIHGDAKFHNVGRVTISSISGDGSIVQAGSAYIGNLSGDLTVQEIEGACHIGNASGDVKARRCGGMVSVDNLGGDFTGQDLRGGIATNNVNGDIHLDTPLVKDASYTVHASSDITLRIRGEIHARFVAQTLRGTIKTRLPLTIERGRRRHLVGALGRAETTVTLQSDSGDIVIEAVDAHPEDFMSDETMNDFSREEAAAGRGTGGEFRFGRNFGVRWDKGPGRFAFSSSYGPDDPDGPGDPRIRRGGKGKMPFEWDDAQRAEYERRIREMSDRTAQAARRAAERATEYAERAAKRARETDWEGVGRDVRSAIERAMGEMEHLLDQFRTGPNAPRRPDAPPPPPPPGAPRSHAHRVPIEQDEPQPVRNKDELDAQRRSILEKLRSGELSMDEAERQLDDLR
ncbi:MAG TPA: DUF4097 family beta strand repeat-containing protein [Ktedonobacterales bacterium]|nr:DUF4097 family beta strand repeat-containing protein [Ktedonobacterales bacterium]